LAGRHDRVDLLKCLARALGYDVGKLVFVGQ